MTPSSLDEFKRRLKDELIAPYVQQIEQLNNRIAILEDKLNQLEEELSKKDEYIEQLEQHIEKLSAGERITKPVHMSHKRKDEEDLVSFIFGTQI